MITRPSITLSSGGIEERRRRNGARSKLYTATLASKVPATRSPGGVLLLQDGHRRRAENDSISPGVTCTAKRSRHGVHRVSRRWANVFSTGARERRPVADRGLSRGWTGACAGLATTGSCGVADACERCAKRAAIDWNFLCALEHRSKFRGATAGADGRSSSSSANRGDSRCGISGVG